MGTANVDEFYISSFLTRFLTACDINYELLEDHCKILIRTLLNTQIFNFIWLHNLKFLEKRSQFLHLHHHRHHISFMELGHLLTRSCLTYPEVSSNVYHNSFCQLGISISLPWVICFEAFYLHIVSSFICIPVICPKFVLFLTPLQFVHIVLIHQICPLFRFYASWNGSSAVPTFRDSLSVPSSRVMQSKKINTSILHVQC